MITSAEAGFREVLASRSYRLFLVAFLLDEICNALWLVTLGWVVARSGSDVGGGVILSATSIPLVLVLIYASGWVDRRKSPIVALLTLAARAVLMLAWVAVVLSDAAPFVLVVVVGAALGAVSGLHEPAMATFPVLLLPDRAQASAMTVERAGQRFSQAAGGVIAGVLIGRGGLGAPALVGAAFVLVAVGVLSRLRHAVPAARPGPPPTPNSSTIGEGFRWVRAHRVLPMTLLVQTSITITMSTVLLVTLPFRARDDGWSATEYGTTITVFGIGMTASTMIGFGLQRCSVRTRLMASCVLALVAGFVVVAIGLVADPLPDSILMGVLGLTIGPAGPFLSGYLRGEAAAADSSAGKDSAPISGRVMAVLILATDAMEPVGFLGAACLALVLPLAAPTAFVGVSCIVFAVLGLWRVGAVRPLDREPVGAESSA